MDRLIAVTIYLVLAVTISFPAPAFPQPPTSVGPGSSLPARVSELEDAVELLQQDLANANTQIIQLGAALADEVAARNAADQALQANIDDEAQARLAADQALQAGIDAEAQARISADQALQASIDAEAQTRSSADQSLQTAIDAESAARVAADQTLEAQLAQIPGTATFTSRVPVEDDDLSILGGVFVNYSDTTSLGQNSNPEVFELQEDGSLVILKAGTINVSASLGVQINNSGGSTDATLSIEVNGVDRASSFANIIQFGGDTLHATLNWKVSAGSVLTFFAHSSDGIHPATMTCCNFSVLTVHWTGVD